MNVPFLDLSRQIAEVRADLDAAIADVLTSGWFVAGPQLESFEDAFAAFCGAEQCIGVASGTDAISIALRAVGVEPGDEVLVPANTCVPSVAGIEAAGAIPVLVDADPVTWTIDAARLDDAVGSRTRAVLPVHLYGLPADMDAILAFARARGLAVVEDAAQAHAAEYRGRRTGNLADAAAFSFYPTKNLGALGDAGAVVTNSATVADHARLLRNYGERRRYESVLAGTNSRLDELQAAILSVKLRRLDGWTERRRAIAHQYREAFAQTPLGLPAAPDERLHSFHLFVVETVARDEFRAQLDQAGVGTLIHYPVPVHRHPAYTHLDRQPGQLSVSERLSSTIVSLPLYPELSDAEVEAVTTSVLRVLQRL